MNSNKPGAAKRKRTPAGSVADRSPGRAPPGVDLSAPGASTAPHMPHERDEGVGMTDGAPSERVQQGERDLKRGVQDTSRAPEADQAYRRLKK